jgi:hypothetical protein
MDKLFKKYAKPNVNAICMELARAHLIIVLLSIAIITLITLGVVQSANLDLTLSAICIVLLTLVTILSLCTSVCLFRRKK